MDILEALRLAAATGCGIQIGGLLLLSLFHRPLFEHWPFDLEISWLFKRFYRFNTIITILSGVLAILAGARSSGFLLAVLGMTYILLLTHWLPAVANQHHQLNNKTYKKLKRSPTEILTLLKKIQTVAHFSQLLALIYIVYLLMT